MSATRQSTNPTIGAWSTSYQEGQQYLHTKLRESQAVLERYYSADVIFPKYRNLPAPTSMYEYLYTGRCSALSGPNGAYNLYESEVRQDTIITQLNIIISQLEQIKNNQYMLYEEMKKVVSNTQIIAGEISAIGSYTYSLTQVVCLNAFYAGIAAEATSAMAFRQALS